MRQRGFQTTKKATVIEFDSDTRSRVFLNGGERGTPSTFDERLDEKMNSAVVPSAHESEAALLEAMTDFV